MTEQAQSTGRIVVGVDGSSGAHNALRWALDEAERRHATVDAVHVLNSTVMSASSPYAGVYIDPVDARKQAERLLDEVVAGEVGRDHRPVQVNPIVIEGQAARVLLDAAQGADLLVVGSRGRGGFAGLLLGSVSQQCAHHAPCPVVVVPS